MLRKAGWDTHGLPVELEVERNLGLDGKEQIERYGVEPFVEECKKSVPVVQQGEFGADMKVSLINDGPFTIILDSDKL